MIDSVVDIFDFSFDDQITVMAGHTPMIEWLAYVLDPLEKIPRDTKLAELTGFVISEDNGKIEVTGTVGL